jgi:hypothetical protein
MSINMDGLSEVLREYISDGGSPEVADEANRELDTIVSELNERQRKITDFELRIETARSAVPEFSRLQHIATKNAMLGKLKGHYDYDEKLLVGDIIHLLEEVMWANTGTFEYPAALVAALESK